MTSSPLPDPGADADLDALRFEQALAQLEALTAQLDAPDLTLDSAVATYERGMALARHCLARLDDAQARVTHLALEDD
jgi:exodeoxyribonuclease VII small subunit